MKDKQIAEIVFETINNICDYVEGKKIVNEVIVRHGKTTEEVDEIAMRLIALKEGKPNMSIAKEPPTSGDSGAEVKVTENKKAVKKKKKKK